MTKVMSATEARIRFGELIQEAQRGPVTVERDGKAVIVVLSKSEYDKITGAAPLVNRREWLHDIHRQIKEELGARTLPDPVEIIRETREERDDSFNLR